MKLLDNPFFILDVTMCDDRRRIMDMAEEKSLTSDETVVRDATAVLTHPRRRLEAEIAWLPGLDPKRTAEVVSILRRPASSDTDVALLLRRLFNQLVHERGSTELRNRDNPTSLTRANLLADWLPRLVGDFSKHDVARWIVELAQIHHEIEEDVEQTISLLNRDRAVAGFPALSDLEHFRNELKARRQYYRQAIEGALDKLSSLVLVEIITMVVDEATENGGRHAPILIDDLVDRFEVRAQAEFFEEQHKRIEALLKRVLEAAKRKENNEYMGRLVTKLEDVVKRWDKVAQPIQVSARSRRIRHNLSHEVAKKIRGLGLELNNEYGLFDLSKRLTTLQQEVFAEVDEIVERSNEDASALDEIAATEAFVSSWNEEITYEAEVGKMFKQKLRISPEGVQWKGEKISLEEISRVRWGGTRHSINGIPTGTTYKIFVGGESGGITIQLREAHIYSEFIGRLWKAVSVGLLTKMLKELRNGGRYRFGTAILTDYGFELERRKLFSANERVPCRWTDLAIMNSAGTFCIYKRDEKKVSAELSYQEMDNVHILEAAMRTFWKNASPRLSDLLNEAS